MENRFDRYDWPTLVNLLADFRSAAEQHEKLAACRQRRPEVREENAAEARVYRRMEREVEGALAKVPKFYECGICGYFHAATWDGDCREDSARQVVESLANIFGRDYWEEVEMPLGDFEARSQRFSPEMEG
jgi:hypothetical protein